MNNKECRTRPELINNNCNEHSFYPFCTRVNKCSGSYNNINDPYSNIMSITNATRHKIA